MYRIPFSKLGSLTLLVNSNVNIVVFFFVIMFVARVGPSVIDRCRGNGQGGDAVVCGVVASRRVV